MKNPVIPNRKRDVTTHPAAAVSRRTFLRMTGLGAAHLLVGGSPELLSGRGKFKSDLIASTEPDVEIALTATVGKVPILAGMPTGVWMYQGRVLKGNAATLQNLPGSYLGPTFRVKHGQKVRIHFTNRLFEKSTIHWHGLRVPDASDGHPRFAVAPGQTYTYEFRVVNRAGTYWYHPHPHMRTGFQTYFGMAGLFLVSDGEEASAGLPTGAFDIPLVIQDRTFQANNQFSYLANGMMDTMMGVLGDQILVSGRPDYVLSVAARAYRLRIVNGSNSRIYKLGWADGAKLTIIGTDGGLLEKPVQRDYVMLSPGERLELWADFSRYPIGTELRLQSLAFSGAVGGMMMSGGSSLVNGAEFTVLRVSVNEKSWPSQELPEKLSTMDRYRLDDAINSTDPRTFRVSMQQMKGTINGRTFEMEAVAKDEVVKLNTLEVWEFVNTPGSMGMMQSGMEMAHPMHIHNMQFQVLGREVRPEFHQNWQTVRDGYVDEGWKDTVLLMPGERVKLLMRFEGYTGLYLYHCHNLEHEDMGLMRNYRIETQPERSAVL